MIVQIIAITIVLVLIIVNEGYMVYKEFYRNKDSSFSKKFLSSVLYVITVFLVLFIAYILWYGYYHPDMPITTIIDTIIKR